MHMNSKVDYINMIISAKSIDIVPMYKLVAFVSIVYFVSFVASSSFGSSSIASYRLSIVSYHIIGIVVVRIVSQR